MKFTKIKIFFLIIIILILGVVLTVASRSASKNTSGKYDTFATCLKDRGAVFYGAFWCSHCNATKAVFGSSKSLLPYIECSTSSGGQTQECKDKKIEGYPTWEFADGSRLTGEVPFETLSEKTSCVLPQ